MPTPMSYYPGLSGKEIDLRRELNRFLTGSSEEIPKGQIMVLRKMRRAAGAPPVPTLASHLQRCDCYTSPTDEPDITYPCRVCGGEGFLYDEEFIVGYEEERFEYIDVEERKKYSTAPLGMSFVYIEYYKEGLSRYDKVLEVQLDTEGEVVSPVAIMRKHNIHMATPFRGDNGRVEYWRLGTVVEF